MSKSKEERKQIDSQTHYCPNFLFHPTALTHFDGATLTVVLPLQRVSNSSFPSFSNGPRPWVSSSLLWSRLPNLPLPLSISFLHINPLYRLEEQDYWSMGLMPFLCTKYPMVRQCLQHTAQAPQCGFQYQCQQQFQQHLPTLTSVYCRPRPRLLSCGSQLTGGPCRRKYVTIWVPELVNYLLFKLS